MTECLQNLILWHFGKRKRKLTNIHDLSSAYMVSTVDAEKASTFDTEVLYAKDLSCK